MKFIPGNILFVFVFLSGSLSAQVLSSTTIQTGNPIVYPNTINNPILRIELVTGPTAVTLTDLEFSTNGSNNPGTDLANAKLWFSGVDSVFSPANATFLSSWTPNGPSPWATQFLFLNMPNNNGGSSTPFSGMVPGQTNYFWLTYDIAPTAVICNNVDAEFYQFKANGSVTLPSLQNPPGYSKIGPCATGISDNYDADFVTIFPVPATEEVTLNFSKKILNTITIDLHDVTGKLKSQMFKGQLGSNFSSLKLSLTDFEPGIYLIRTRYEGKENFNKIVIF